MKELSDRVEGFVREHELIPDGGEVTCLVSGGADSTCLWLVLRDLGYGVSAVHVNHKLRGDESEQDAEFCRDVLGAEVIDAPGATGEAHARMLRFRASQGRGRRATGHTASDQIETVLYNLVSRGMVRGMDAHQKLADVIHPLLPVWRSETEAFCRTKGVEFRVDSTNAETKRGLMRREVLPLLRELHPGADRNLLLALEKETMPSAVSALLSSPAGSKRIDLGGGLLAVREYDRIWLEKSVPLDGEVRWGEWAIRSELAGLRVRGWRPGDRLAGRRRKIQDVFVDAKVPRSEREAWPLVVRGDEVVAVPGIVEHPEVQAVRN